MTAARTGRPPIAKPDAGPDGRDAATDVAALARLVRRAGGFLFAPVEIDLAATAARFADDLAAALAPARLAIVTLERGEPDLIGRLAQAASADVAAVLAWGLGDLVDAAADPGQWARLVNFNREALRDRIGQPLVLVAPRRTLAMLARRAPDLWAWRATLVDRAPDAADVAAEVATQAPAWGSSAADKRAAAARAPVAAALAEEAGAPDSVKAEAALRAGLAARHVDDLAGAAEHLGAALAGYRAVGDRLGEAHARLGLGDLARRTDDRAGAAEHLGAALAGYRAVGDRLGEANARLGLGQLAERTDDRAGAAQHLAAALTGYRVAGAGDLAAQVEALLAALDRVAGSEPR